MDLIVACPKLICINSEGTFFRGFITAEVKCLLQLSAVLIFASSVTDRGG